MKVWPIALGVGAATGMILMLVRRAGAASTQVMYGESKIVSLAVPPGWRRVTSAEVAAVPDLASHAVTLRNTTGFSSMAYGTLLPFVASDGRTYATWIEQHYREPGSSVKPWGYHHGVTLLARIEP